MTKPLHELQHSAATLICANELCRRFPSTKAAEDDKYTEAQRRAIYFGQKVTNIDFARQPSCAVFAQSSFASYISGFR